jgi:predicted flap endonuclease-1-like 5' DNA nuclease
VAGIGPKRAERLRAEGILTARQLALLADADAERLAARSGIPMRVLSVCIRDARQLVKASSGHVVTNASKGGEEPERN